MRNSLLRNTLLYLPAQLLPALAQFVALIAWSHFVSKETIGVVSVTTATQDIINTVLTGFWIQYTIRHLRVHKFQNEASFNMTASFVIVGSIITQSILINVFYKVSFPKNTSLIDVFVLSILTGSRALNLFQGERGRASDNILLYSVSVMMGPLIGLPLGLFFVSVFGDKPIFIFLGLSCAQLFGTLIGFCIDGNWIQIGRPDWRVIIDAIKYGGPLIAGGLLSWITQNAPRMITSLILGLGSAGVYSIGFGLGYRASMVASLAVTAAAFPLAVKMSVAGDERGAIRQLAINGTLLFALVGISVALLGTMALPVLQIWLPTHLVTAVYGVLISTLPAGLFYCLKTFYVNQIFLLKRKTSYIAFASAIEAAIGVVLSYVLVAHIGLIGAGIAMSVATGFGLALSAILALRLGLEVFWLDLFKVVISVAAMMAIISRIRTMPTWESLLVTALAGGMTLVFVMSALYIFEIIHFIRSGSIGRNWSR